MKRAPRIAAEDIDWGAVRARLAAAAVATEDVHKRPPEERQRILDERARRLAQPLETGRERAALSSAVLFALGRERYAVEARFVREILRLTELAPVPGTPEFVVGVTNLRGEILAVFDIRIFFGLAMSGVSNRARVLVCGEDRPEFGVIADDVSDVADMSFDNLVTELPFEAENGRDCIIGVAKDAVIVLDGEALLRDRRLYIGQPDQPDPRTAHGERP